MLELMGPTDPRTADVPQEAQRGALLTPSPCPAGSRDDAGPPDIDDIRVVHGIAAPGAAATTLGSTVFVRRGVTLAGRLRRHEYEHVLQFHRHGWVGFFRRYVSAYVRWRLRRHGHLGAYRRIPFEVQAEWRARRELGIGVLRRD